MPNPTDPAMMPGSLDVSGCAAVCSDRELLRRFLDGDEPAFSLLVERQGPMVLGVCRRVLRQVPDAEDAFQATFLVLARRARSSVWQESIAGWLHETARRTALKLRSATARRQKLDRETARSRTLDAAIAVAPPPASAQLHERAEILDAELADLPSRLRDVILLAQVEGLGREETAQRLGISVAAVKDRLERGREQLRRRLVRRGITLSAATLAAWLVPAAAQAGAVSLTAATAQAATAFATGAMPAGSVPTAVALAQGVLKMMGLEKIKAAAVCVISLFMVGTVAYGMLQDDPQRFEKGLRGHVVSMSESTNPTALTIDLDEFGSLLSLDISPDAKVWTAFETGGLSDVKPGRYVSLRLGDDHRTVREIHVLGEQREVSIRTVGASGTITAVVADDEDDEEERPVQAPLRAFQLAPDAIVRIGGVPAYPDELKPGMVVPLEFSRDGKTVNAIEVEGAPGQLVEGEIVSIDAGASVVHLRTELDGDETAVLILKLPPDSLILLDRRPARPADLRPGCDVVARLDEAKTAIRALRATSPEADEGEEESEDESDE